MINVDPSIRLLRSCEKKDKLRKNNNNNNLNTRVAIRLWLEWRKLRIYARFSSIDTNSSLKSSYLGYNSSALFFFYSKESILYSRISRRQSATRPLGKGSLLHFPWELHGYVMQASVSPFFPSLPPSHSRFSLFFRQQHRRKFRELRANCSKVKRTTPIMQPTVATSHALSLYLSLCLSISAELFILQIYYWHYVT